MIRCLRPLLLALGLATTAAAAATAPVQGEQLEQVVLLSRHNLRAPVVASGALAHATPEHWTPWDVSPGELTTKGGVLEVYMGRYIGQWLRQAQLLPGRVARSGLTSTPMPTACSAPRPPRSSSLPAHSRVVMWRSSSAGRWARWIRCSIR